MKADLIIPPDQREGSHIELGAWLKSVGDFVHKDEPVAELVTDKAVVELPSPVSGVLVEILFEAETAVEPDAVLGRIEVAEGKEQTPSAKNPQSEPPTPEVSAPTRAASDPRSHPALVRYAGAKQIDLSRIEGTAPGGRVRAADLPGQGDRASRSKAPSSPLAMGEGDQWVRHDPMRRAIARHMEASVHTAPHVTAVFECDLSRVLQHRASCKQEFSEEGINLTLTAYLLRAMVEGVKAAPEVNSRFYPDGLHIYRSLHIGVGTALEDQGLVVPVVRFADTLDLKQTATELTKLTELARAKSLQPQDMRGSTLSLSNHGVMGSLVATPIIINQPESAIVGAGKIEKRVKVISDGSQDRFEARPCMYLSLTIDHRALDAFHTNRFLSAMVEHLEASY